MTLVDQLPPSGFKTDHLLNIKTEDHHSLPRFHTLTKAQSPYHEATHAGWSHIYIQQDPLEPARSIYREEYHDPLYRDEPHHSPRVIHADAVFIKEEPTDGHGASEKDANHNKIEDQPSSPPEPMTPQPMTPHNNIEQIAHDHIDIERRSDSVDSDRSHSSSYSIRSDHSHGSPTFLDLVRDPPEHQPEVKETRNPLSPPHSYHNSEVKEASNPLSPLEVTNPLSPLPDNPGSPSARNSPDIVSTYIQELDSRPPPHHQWYNYGQWTPYGYITHPPPHTAVYSPSYYHPAPQSHHGAPPSPQHMYAPQPVYYSHSPPTAFTSHPGYLVQAPAGSPTSTAPITLHLASSHPHYSQPLASPHSYPSPVYQVTGSITTPGSRGEIVSHPGLPDVQTSGVTTTTNGSIITTGIKRERNGREVSPPNPQTGERTTPAPSRAFSSAQEVTCQICTARFASTGHLKRHMQAHGANRRFRCQFCDCSYSRQDNLRKHVNAAHGPKTPNV